MNTTSHQLTPNVKLLHKAVIIYEKKVLILRRSPKSPSRPNCWDLPGGNSEWPQDKPSGFDYHTHDISRELQEEIDLTVDPTHFTRNTLTYFHSYFDTDKDIYTIICGWQLILCDLPNIPISHEHTKYQWVEPSSLEELDFGGKAGNFIKDIIQASSKKPQNE